MATKDKPKILWHTHYYKGPLYGLAEYKGEKVWYEFTNDPEITPRLFDLFELTNDNLIRIEEEQNRFRKEVGYNHEHDVGLFQPVRNFQADFISYQPEINCSTLKGKKIASFSQGDFLQYNVERKIKPMQEIVQ